GVPSADVFSLGKALYFALTNLPIQRFPDVPEQISQSPQADVIDEFLNLLLRACEPISGDRYRSADEFAVDLRAFRDRLQTLSRART
ncbi:MAG: hypothetical protein L0Z50_03805, partial [Verrucomicrobiales bacterium]|nr:hypothetical protein [Verrucomicrobiales bacterium]